ncbi:MAG: hypothetical protein JWO62_879 [Acidimicrobiaceae bacterium]|jgi:hypothetical protein|nr:hypothetical protein [Acidimicrobiaceae bacterium]
MLVSGIVARRQSSVAFPPFGSTCEEPDAARSAALVP